MSIKDWWSKIKAGERGRNLILILIVVLTGGLGFGLGRWSKIEDGKTSIRIEGPSLLFEEDEKTSPARSVAPPVAQPAIGPNSVTNNPAASAPAASGKYVASKNSNKYHLPWCPGALRIKEENKVWFNSREEAERAGYGPAANCKGL